MTGSKAVMNDPLINSSREFFENPYPVLADIRQQAPVMWSEKGRYWLVTRYDIVHGVLSDLQYEKGARPFKALNWLSKLVPGGADVMDRRGHNMLQANPPDHTRMRGLVNKAFTPKMITELVPRIENITNRLLDAVQEKGKMDLIADFAFPLPATVIAEMLGIPGEDHSRFKNWSHAITNIADPNPDPNVINLAKIMMAYKELEHYLHPLIEERRKNRKDDLISNLVAAEEEGTKLTENELLSNIVLMLIAGHETTTNLIGNGILALLQNPPALQKLKAEPELMNTAVSEFLRYDSPVQIVRRIATQDIELGGQKIKAEDSLMLSLGAANRDPEQFAHPDQLDIERSPNKHVSFGYGIHHCLGSTLAETEGRIAIGTLLKRMPDIALESGAKLEHKSPFSLRGLKEFPVRF